jgi:class 3 adenylate cyclase/predicted ATPase
MDIAAWLRELGLERYEQVLRDNDIDAKVLPHLTAEDLKDIGITSVGHRRRLLAAIEALRAETATPASRELSVTAPPADEPSREAERRQLTVMFVDLVESTALSARLDPEDMGAVIRRYQERCGEVVSRWDGHVAKYMGDGVLAYFGWPQAHEDDAERAVRAGLDLAQEVEGLTTTDGVPLAARVGIATGLVMVGDLVGEGAAQEQRVVGGTPNLAARLQALADPGTVVIAEGTRRLLGGLFEYLDLGRPELKGFAAPVRAWRVVGESRAESRFEALHGQHLTALVGREHEIGLLMDRWERAKEGEGQVVLLAGEPGIGKSRIVRALRERLADEPHTPLSHYCSPHHTNSALYPVIGLLERAAGFSRDDRPDTRLDKLEALLARGTETPGEAVPLVAALLGLETGERYPAPALSPQRQKQRTLEVLIEQVEGLAVRQPVLAVYEDVHWIDPTTLEALGLLIERVQRLPVLALITFRPEFSPPWTGHAHVMQLSLSRLTRRHGQALVAAVTGGKALPDEVLDQILAKTDGVPLFVEELTKAVLESGLLSDAGDRYALAGPLAPLAIPATLHDSLMARLDRLAPVKEVAQIGAALGREFAHELVAAVSPLPADRLGDALDQLVAAELVFRRGTPPEATYSFKHALVQDAAYQSLLKSTRHQLHARIAQILERRFPAIGEATPEVVAHHYTEAGFAAQAIDNWLRAGRLASERSAQKEALSHVRRGLDLVPQLPEGEDRDQRHYDLLIRLCPALMALGSYSTPEIEQAYAKARKLGAALEDPARDFTAAWGLWQVYNTRPDHERARDIGRQLLASPATRSDDGFRLQACHASWTTAYHLGDLAACRELTEEGIRIYDVERHRAHKFVYGGHDPGCCCRMHSGLVLWHLGYPEQALARVQDAVALARSLDHPFTLILMLALAAARLHQIRRESGLAGPLAEEAAAVGSQRALAPPFAATARLLLGWAQANEGDLAAGIRQMRTSLDELTALRMQVRMPYYHAVFAECELLAGDLEPALETVERGLGLVEALHERHWEPELHRLKGELMRRLPRRYTIEQAEAALQCAVEVSRQLDARSLELRAAMSLARLWRDQGKRAEAHDLLAPVYGWFTEGFDTADLKDAKTLLDELR